MKDRTNSGLEEFVEETIREIVASPFLAILPKTSQLIPHLQKQNGEVFEACCELYRSGINSTQISYLLIAKAINLVPNAKQILLR